MDLNTAGSIASIVGLADSFTRWIRSAISEKSKASDTEAALTIEHYKEWLRRENHREVLERLGDSERAVNALSAILEGLSLQTEQSVREILNRVEDSDLRLESLASQYADVRRQLVLFANRAEKADRDFETAYNRQIESEYGHLRLVGIPEMRQIKQLSGIAYVSLGLRHGVSQEVAGAAEVLMEMSELGITGNAGSGKTTLLHWIALQCASSDEGNPWHGGVPFLIALRKLRGRDRRGPNIGNFHKYTLDQTLFVRTPPKNWIQRVLDSDRGVILLDGVDELPPDDRPYFWEWLSDFADLCHGNRIYLTSRPLKEEQWQPPRTFGYAELQPMNEAAIRRFIANWHNSVIQADIYDERDKQELENAKNSLPLKLREPRNQQVKELCRTPLLCSLVCALHWREWGYLPSRRVDLYDRCCSMLIDERDRKREIQVSEGPLRALEYRDKEMLLQRLALDMMRNAMNENNSGQQIEVSRREAINWLRPNINACDNADARSCKADELLDYFVLRTGLLREPSTGRIDFPHKTFQEYLAACAAGALNQLGFLLSKIEDDQWQETIVLAAGTKVGGVGFGNALVEGLLDHGTRTKNESSNSSALLLATACLETCHQMSERNRERITGNLPTLLPPENSRQSHIIAMAGNAVLDLLRPERWRNSDVSTAAACAHSVALVGTDKAKSMITKRGGYGYDRRSSVISRVCEFPGLDPVEVPRIAAWIRSHPVEEIPRQIRPFFASIAPLVADLNVIELDLSEYSHVTDIASIAGLKCLTRLILNGMRSLEHIASVGELHELRFLNLANCESIVDFSPIGKLKKLSELNLSGNNQIGNLTFLDGTRNLRLLSLAFIGELDLSPISSLPFLTVLDIRGCRRLRGLSALKRSSYLQEVVVDKSIAKEVSKEVGSSRVASFSTKISG